MENIKEMQSKLELITRRGWFFLLFILNLFVPPYVSKGSSLQEWGKITDEILSQAIIYNLPFLVYLIFKIIPIILICSIILFKNKVARLFSVYVAITYVLFALLQNIAISQKHGLGIVTTNLIMFLAVALFWFWEAIVCENDFAPQKQPLWKYWVVPFALLAFWYPTNPKTLMPDFNPLYLFTNDVGLAFCMMTPVYIAILTLYYPRINIATLRVTSLVGTIIAFSNMLSNFLIAPDQLWWNGVLHLPLLIISIYGLILSLRKKPVERY